MNQIFLSGIGNIYASEILFDSAINPKRNAGQLIQKEADALYRSIRNVLLKAIKYRGTSMRNYRDTKGKKGGFLSLIKVYGREGRPCFICGEPIKRIVQAGRSTFFCHHCQR